MGTGRSSKHRRICVILCPKVQACWDTQHRDSYWESEVIGGLSNMTQGPDHAEDGEHRLFSEYGELVLLLDADPQVLHEAIKDCNQHQLLKIIQVIEDQLNDTPIEGNKELFMRHLYVWMYAIRQKDDEDEHFMLDFEEWEYDQFYWSNI